MESDLAATVSSQIDTPSDFSMVVSKTYHFNDVARVKPILPKTPANVSSYSRRIAAARKLRATYRDVIPDRLALTSLLRSYKSNSSRRKLSAPAEAGGMAEEATGPENANHMNVLDAVDVPETRNGTALSVIGAKDDVGGFTIQDCACTDLPPGLPRCLECRQAEMDNESAYCRFRDFRKLSSFDNSNEIRPLGFINHHYCSSSRKNDASDIHEWLPVENTLAGSMCNKRTARFILVHIAGYFRQLLEKERTLLKSASLRLSSHGGLPWKDSTGVRELCDVCSTTIFNLHVMCPHCGLCVCPDCFQDRRALRSRDASASQDEYGWAYCTRNTGEESHAGACHNPFDMILAHLIPGRDSNILFVLEELEREMAMQLENTTAKSFTSRSLYYSTFWYMHDDQILVLRRDCREGNLHYFQCQWETSLPMIVEGIHERLNQDLWKPTVFAKLCADHSSDNCIVDCRVGKTQKHISVQEFWDGFSDCSKRLRDKEKRKQYLKLKDWPPGDRFASVLRDHYVDFCKALPIPDYTHPETGRYNLATKLPPFCLAPDLGPKMYTAYDMIFEPEKGTTNLHLDVSDAVNVLVNVTTPSNINPAYLYIEILSYLETQGLDEKDLERARRDPHLAGALWTIFRPEDNGIIRKFLQELRVSRRRGDVSDPIHDQQIYLDRSLRLRLEEECDVEGFTFVQMLGDAVFIPAGAAHQVQNLLCCIKVAEDFVSPEGVQRCAVIADEFRSLTTDHSNHEDKLQLPNIVTHAVKDAVGVMKGLPQ